MQAGASHDRRQRGLRASTDKPEKPGAAVEPPPPRTAARGSLGADENEKLDVLKYLKFILTGGVFTFVVCMH